MRTVEEITTAMNAVVDGKETMSDEDVKTYEALEAELKGIRNADELKKRQAAYMAPRVAIVPANPRGKGEDAEQIFEFENYLRTGQKTAGLTFAQSEGTGSEGGYLVPTVLQNRMVEVRKAFGGLAPMADHISTNNGAPINYPVMPWEDTVEAEVTAESGTFGTGDDIAFDTVSLSAYKFTSAGPSGAKLAVPYELSQDSLFPIGEFVTRRLALRIARKMALAYTKGTGSGEPAGIWHQIGNTNVADSGNALKYSDLNALVFSLDRFYRETGNCRWLFNDKTLGVISALVDTTGRPLLQPYAASGVAGEVPGSSLLGYPVTIDNGSPDLAPASAKPGAVNDGGIIFGDLRESFIIRDVMNSAVILVDPYSLSDKGQIGYSAWDRTDSAVQNRNAYVILSGYHS